MKKCKTSVYDSISAAKSALHKRTLREYFASERLDYNRYYIIKSGASIDGTASEPQLRYDEPLTTQYFRLGPDMFMQAKEFLHEHESARNKHFLVLNEADESVACLWWDMNMNCGGQDPHGLHLVDYWNYDFRYGRANERLLGKVEAFVFDKLEEYSHAIAMYVLSYMPDKTVYFLDELANLPVWGTENGRVKVLRGFEYLPQGPRYMFINASAWNNNSWVPDFISLAYSSQNVVFSMMCEREVLQAGGKCSDKKIMLLDNRCKAAGLVDVITIICNSAYYAEKHGYVPVVDLSEEGCCQYWEPGVNVWEALFQPLNGMSVDEARQCRTLVHAKDEEGGGNILAWMYSPYWREAVYATGCYANDYTERSQYYNDKTKLNAESWRFVLEHAPKPLRSRLAIQANDEAGIVPHADQEMQNTSILGVMMRGSDFRMEANRMTHRSTQNASVDCMLGWARSLMASGSYDYIFLATEDQEYKDKFTVVFGDKLLSVPQPRIFHDYVHDGYATAADLFKEKINSGIGMARIYLTVVKCLSVCDDLLSSMVNGAYRQAVRWNQGRYGLCKVIAEHQFSPCSARMARIELKNAGGSTNYVGIAIKSQQGAFRISQPSWLTDDSGKGLLIEVTAEGQYKCAARIKCVGAGTLTMLCRGADVRDPERRQHRLPFWITYTQIIIDGREMLQEPVDVWHDRPIQLKKEVTDGTEFDIEISWRPYSYLPEQISGLLQVWM